MKEQRLFDAIGEADGALLERSEQKAKKQATARWIKGGLAAAACLALVSVIALQPFRQQSSVQPPDDGKEATSILSQNGAQIGSLHLMEICYASEAVPSSVDFAMYINESMYYTREENGIYSVLPLMIVDDGSLPECALRVSHLEDISVGDAIENQRSVLSESFAEVSESAPWIMNEDMTFFSAGNGTAWDAAQMDVWCIDDRSGGVFLITASYFTEATEGHGARFADMVSTFRIVDAASEAASPAWVGELRTAVDTLTAAFFANSPANAGDYLAEGAIFATYGEDVSGDVSIAAVKYTVDNDQSPTGAFVSVTHRVGTEDSYTYISMELVYENGLWKATFAGLEK